MKYFCCKREILTRTILGLGMRLRSPSRVSGHRGECCRMLAARRAAAVLTAALVSATGSWSPAAPSCCSTAAGTWTIHHPTHAASAACSRPSVTVLQVLVAAGARRCSWTLTLSAVCSGAAAWCLATWHADCWRDRPHTCKCSEADPIYIYRGPVTEKFCSDAVFNQPQSVKANKKLIYWKLPSNSDILWLCIYVGTIIYMKIYSYFA